MVTSTMHMTTNCSCCRAMDPDMALGYRASLVDTTAPGGNAGHSDLYGPDRGIVLGH